MGCYEKAVERGEPTFVLRGQDIFMPAVVAAWIKDNIESAPPEKLHEALAIAIRAREWPARKLAD